MDRGDLSDAKWAPIGTLPPPERGRWARPAGDNRRFLNGMLHVLRVGCPWRDMHERYGKWNSVYVRFRAPLARSALRQGWCLMERASAG
jgi:transposase